MMLKKKHLAILMFVVSAPGLFAMRAFTGAGTVDFGAVAGNIGLNLPSYLDVTSVSAPVVTTARVVSSMYSASNAVDFGGLAVTTVGGSVVTGGTANVVSFAPVVSAGITSSAVGIGQIAVPMVTNSVSFGSSDNGLSALFARLAAQNAGSQNNNLVFTSPVVGGITGQISAAPEPSTLALLGIGTIALGLFRRRR
jgi:hypothetical protein